MFEDTYGTHCVKLPAGHLVLNPSTSLHHVTPVPRGTRALTGVYHNLLRRWAEI